jgi:hypothetical protein
MLKLYLSNRNTKNMFISLVIAAFNQIIIFCQYIKELYSLYFINYHKL